MHIRTPLQFACVLHSNNLSSIMHVGMFMPASCDICPAVFLSAGINPLPRILQAAKECQHTGAMRNTDM